MAGDGLSPRAVAPQQVGQVGGQGDDPVVLAGPDGVAEAGDQIGSFGPGPGQSPRAVRQAGNRGRYRADRGGRARPGLAGDEGVGAGGGVLVVIQQPGGRTFPVLVRVQGASQGAGVLTDQVVQPVPARDWLGQKVLVVQGLQAAAGRGQAGAVQRGRGVGVDVCAGGQPQPAEQPLLVPGQIGIRQVERGGDR